MRKFTLLIWWSLLVVPVAWGQSFEDLEGVHVYGEPGEPRMTVYVWGQARSGVWRVAEGTDLIEFMSIASQTDMTLRDPDRRSETFIRIYRDGEAAGGNEAFFSAKVEDLFSRQQSYPALEDGDIVMVDTRVRRRFTWRDLSQIVGTISSGISLYLLLDRL